MTRFRQRIGEDGCEKILAISVAAGLKSKAIKPSDLKRVTLIGSSNGGGLLHRLMIECDEPLALEELPVGVELIHQDAGATVTLWLRDRELRLNDHELAMETGRRAAGLGRGADKRRLGESYS